MNMLNNKRRYSVMILLLFIVSILAFFPFNTRAQIPPPLTEFTYGMDYYPDSIDPIDTYGNDVIDQVVETLFYYDLSDPELKIIPKLAEWWDAENEILGEWSNENTTYTISLKSGIVFHDDTLFNAEVVVWNFDRIYAFLEENPYSVTYSFYYWPDQTRIIESVIPIEDDVVQFDLSQPFAALDALLCFSGSTMLSSNSYPEDGELVGTGPFIYDGFFDHEFAYDEYKFHANANYRTGPPSIDLLTFKIIPSSRFPDYRPDRTEVTQALLNGDVDYIKSPDFTMFSELEYDPEIILVDAGTTASSFYFGMNNQLIPDYMREAISYALDYDRIIQEVTLGESVRSMSPVPLGIRYANWELNVPGIGSYEDNIINARNALIDSELYENLPPPDFDEENNMAWQALAESEETATGVYSFSHHWGADDYRMAYLYILQDSLSQIGVMINDDEIDWFTFYERLTTPELRNELNLYYLGWGFDYNDPSNMLNSLYTFDGEINGGQVYDDDIDQALANAMMNVNPIDRQRIYNRIQQRLIEEIYASCWLYVPRNFDAYNVKFMGFQPNPMEKVDLYHVTLSDNLPPTIIHDTIPDEIKISYTRSPQIIGSIKVYDLSKILSVTFYPSDDPDPGFSLSTTYFEGEYGGTTVYFSETTVMTTESLERGSHMLSLLIVDDKWNVQVKSFTVNVYRQADLKLRGEFDYLEKETVKISVVALAFDREENFLLIPSEDIDFTVHLQIVDYNGVIKVPDQIMQYDSNGFFHWDSSDTIHTLKDMFPKGIYIVQGWVEFTDASYYEGGNDVIQFHIDPPTSDTPIFQTYLVISGFIGVSLLSLVCIFLYLRERRHRC
ncbi:MAG: ABC transporter substrate-binding protein [Candidatus Lokiarchaeota archaeon]|nr:ABC transporter substrate-binding protein [Candidatus Lokiarchaeota archaeon]